MNPNRSARGRFGFAPEDFPEHDTSMRTGLFNQAGGGDGGGDVGRARQDAVGSDDGRQLVGAVDAILQRQDDRVRRAQGWQPRQHRRVVIAFDGEQDEIGWSDLLRLAGGLRAAHDEVAEGTPYQQPAFADGAQMRAAGNEGDLMAGPRQPRAIISAHRP